MYEFRNVRLAISRKFMPILAVISLKFTLFFTFLSYQNTGQTETTGDNFWLIDAHERFWQEKIKEKNYDKVCPFNCCV